MRLLKTFEGLSSETSLTIPACREVIVTRSSAIGEPARETHLISAPLSVFLAENFIFEPHSQVLAKHQRLFRQSRISKRWKILERENLGNRSSFVVWSNNYLAAVKKLIVTEKREWETGIPINGQFPDNWYHWIVNILPRAFLVESRELAPPEVPFLVSSSIHGTTMEEALRSVIRSGRRIEFLENRAHTVRNGLIVESPVREVCQSPKSLTPINWSELGNFHYELMEEFRAELLQFGMENLEASERPSLSRIYFARKGSTSSRPFNESEVISLLSDYGFIALDFSELTFREQIRSSSQAKIMCGITGSAWTNFLFTERAVGVTLVPEFLRESSLFSKLGALGGSTLFDVPLRTVYPTWRSYFGGNRSGIVDLDLLTRTLDTIESWASSDFVR